LNTKVAPAINNLIASQKGYSEIWGGLALDWSIMAAPTLTKTDLELGIKGLFYPNNQDEVAPPVTPPVMPYHDDTNPSLV